MDTDKLVDKAISDYQRYSYKINEITGLYSPVYLSHNSIFTTSFNLAFRYGYKGISLSCKRFVISLIPSGINGWHYAKGITFANGKKKPVFILAQLWDNDEGLSLFSINVPVPHRFDFDEFIDAFIKTLTKK